MSITLHFRNPNTRTLTNIDIYRTEYPVVIPDVPTDPPLFSLDGFVESIVDDTTVEGKDYNYRFRIYKPGGESMMSPTYTFGDVSVYGPGDLKHAVDYGTNSHYCGLADDPEILPTQEQLCAYIGSTETTIPGWTGKWHKYRNSSGIYFSPEKAYIDLRDPDQFNQLMANFTNDVGLTCGHCDYTLLNTAGNDLMVLASIDGNKTFGVHQVGEYPSRSWRYPLKLLFDVNPPSTGLVLSSNNGYVYYLRGSATDTELSMAQTGWTQITSLNSASYVWFWKPVILFKPKTVRNYP